jgi:large subunit ribosomal protein L6
MSRIARKPVMIPAGVKVAVNAASRTVNFEGPKGKLSMTYRPEVGVTVEGSKIDVTMDPAIVDLGSNKAFWGTTRALIATAIEGVLKGYEKKLEIVGVGYLAAIQKNVLQLRVGFANELQVPIPAGLTVTCPDQTHISIKGIDKQLVGQFAAEVRALRKPEPYKGKGIRYEAEQVRRKAGKAVTK